MCVRSEPSKREITQDEQIPEPGHEHLIADVEWIPSHDKYPDWQPVNPAISVERARRLNKEADSKASHFARLVASQRKLTDFENRMQTAASWSTRQLNRLVLLQGRWLLDNEDLAALYERWHADFDPAGRRARA